MNNANELDELDELAAEVYDYCCAHRADNMKKDGGLQPGNPRNVGCEFTSLYDQAKTHYRNVARWHLAKQKNRVFLKSLESPNTSPYLRMEGWCPECREVVRLTMGGLLLCDKHKNHLEFLIPDGEHLVRLYGNNNSDGYMVKYLNGKWVAYKPSGQEAWIENLGLYWACSDKS